ncbi:MAG: hypothetical protein K2J15_06285 [Muribaculaceae bacterium]|nr:hypothetical protein [Muribaculaceae bacterium]
MLIFFVAAGCDTVEDDRIPNMPVNINLSDPGMWNTYGVSGFGDFSYFVFMDGSAREPSGFPYTDISATGFGGVLLIEGMDPFEMQTGVPLAYDLSCPVERSRTIRVRIDPADFEAVCPVCDSHYDVTMAGGAPVAGPALTGSHKYGLKRYYCHPASTGGYIINSYR